MITNLRLPSPTFQEYIQKAVVSDEFKDFILALAHHPHAAGHLLFNIQDRNSWKEHARCKALEELEHHDNFKERLTVVTLAKDTDFYHQLSPYHRENNAALFMQAFLQQLSDEKGGFYFPQKVKEMLFPDCVNQLMKTIHHLFFFDKNVLSREQRLSFIDLFYLFLELKILEIVQPDTFSFSCKDAIDAGAAANAEFYGFVKLLQGQTWEEGDIECLNLIIYGASLLLRERVIHSDRLNRVISAFKVMEGTIEELNREPFVEMVYQQLAPLFKRETLQPIVLPQPLI